MTTLTVPFKPSALASNLLFAAGRGDAARLSRELAHARSVLSDAVQPATPSFQSEMADLLDALSGEMSTALETCQTGAWDPAAFPIYLLEHVAGAVQ